MKAIYYIYKQDTGKLLISPFKLYNTEIKKPLYKDKEAKIEAIWQIEKKKCSPKEINDYITNNYFNTPKWSAYRKKFEELKRQKKLITYEYLYPIEVTISYEMPPEDPKLIKIIEANLSGSPLEEFRDMKNPILELKKIEEKYPTVEEEKIRLGQELKAERERQGLSKYQIRALTDVQLATIESIENGKTDFTFTSLLKYALALNKRINILDNL